MTPWPARGQHFLLLHFKEPVSHGQHSHPLYCCPPVSSQDRCSLMMEEISIAIIVILIFICNLKMNKNSTLINKVFIYITMTSNLKPNGEFICGVLYLV